MQLPLQISYQHMEPSESVDAMIREKAAKLDQFYERIMSCRVVVEALHKPHRTSNQYRVRIDLTVPGGELVVNRDPAEQTDAKDVAIAVRDAFEAARRQLEDFAQKQRGDVKSH